MKETGIIMSGDHPQKIRDLLKTQTRRTYGLEKVNGNPGDWEFKRLNKGAVALFWRSNVMEEDIALCKCPYGQVGDRLWVRETWAAHEYYDDRKPCDIPEGVTIECKVAPDAVKTNGNGHRKIREGERGKWRPSIFMPRWASRITLEITEVRVERVQEISEGGAIAEGAIIKHSEDTDEAGYSFRLGFIDLWDSLNAKKYPWSSNPWVWCVSFRRIP